MTLKSFCTYNLAQGYALAQKAQSFALDKVFHFGAKRMSTKVLKFHFKRKLQTKDHMRHLVCNLRLQTKVVVLRFNHTQKICYRKNLTRARFMWYNFGAVLQTKVLILVSQTKVHIYGQNKTPINRGLLLKHC